MPWLLVLAALVLLLGHGSEGLARSRLDERRGHLPSKTALRSSAQGEMPLFDAAGFYRSPLRLLQDGEERTCYARNMPGDGNCLFYAVSVALSTNTFGVHPRLDGGWLLAGNKGFRDNIGAMLQSDAELYIEGKRKVAARELLKDASLKEGCSEADYLRRLRQIQGPALWGGGPELVCLANILRRPIEVFEMESAGMIRRAGIFGSPLFDDPLQRLDLARCTDDELEDAALSGLVHDWAIRVLIVDRNFPDAPTPGSPKHALALFFTGSSDGS